VSSRNLIVFLLFSFLCGEGKKRFPFKKERKKEFLAALSIISEAER
jgi:hypothetical protein